MALNYQKLFLLGKKLKYNDPEFTFTFVSNDLNLQGKKWSNMYLFPTSETDDEMRIDFAVGENLQTRIKNYGKSFNHNGAFYLMPNENSATNFYLDDSDGGLDILLENNVINKEIYDYITETMRCRRPLPVNIEIKK
jgi:hypothetical protein